MKPYLVKTPHLVQQLFPKRVWCFPKSTNSVYLTFDDGPIPQVTPWVLNTLKQFNAKATFFCIGDNINKYPKIFKRLISEGHSIGNHTYNHLNGWITQTDVYIQNCEMFNEILNNPETSGQDDKSQISNLFRPPYGKITSKQSKILQKKDYEIIMWDVLSTDFDETISEKKCLQNVIQNTKEGSIVVFHDSLKAEKNLKYTLPKVLSFIESKGWKCEKI